ncbi:WSC-domain-containing protein [Xylariaceae sp. FL0016]|nr:WSC-domain-containing protein [Xylariaceae sp. FL0016]
MLPPSIALLGSLFTAAVAAVNFEGVTLAVNTQVGTYKYLGCANEIPGRALTGLSYSDDKMTIESCQAFCTKNNAPLSGVEYGRECYCGRYIASPAALGANNCNMNCGGNSKQMCGGYGRVSIFNNTNPLSMASAPKTSGTWQYQSCYMEPQNGRALDTLIKADDKMTVDMCTSACAAAKYPFAGLEYGRECWCGQTKNPNIQDASDPQCAMQCDMPCGGNSKQICGGRLTMSLYRNSAKREEGGDDGSTDDSNPAANVDTMRARKGRFIKVRKVTA